MFLIDREAIKDAIQTIMNSERPEGVTLYGDGKSGFRIADVLAKTPLTIEKRLTY